ncbi:hypothetical protein [Arthrobacter sp. efr-133-TYG-104]|uniref:hypothetical protein n=1 Tax=Arthrobacter sp. efr-133-TYG-104 TaxID=3040324 RepID=UPI002550376E|nr:hypothetical protein [Arthrobacter sp. efr-133-TYG-104]
MTDARHPERWLNDKRIQRLSGDEYRAYSLSLMWAVSNRTDGLIEEIDLAAIPHIRQEHAKALVKAGLWCKCEQGWMIIDFATTQTSKSEIEASERARRKEAERKAASRARSKEGQAEQGAGESAALNVTSEPVTPAPGLSDSTWSKRQDDAWLKYSSPIEAVPSAPGPR